MTEALKLVVDALGPSRYTINYLTAPPSATAPASINSPADAEASTLALAPHLTPSLLSAHAAFLIACYSAHPLVPYLRAQPAIRKAQKPVIGILEASVLVALGEIGAAAASEDEEGEEGGGGGEVQCFGIVSTGAAWAVPLADAVRTFVLGQNQRPTQGAKGEGEGEGDIRLLRFVGVTTTGLAANELHTAAAEDVRARLKGAVGRLLKGESEGRTVARTTETRGKVRAICLGCAGMAGLDAIVREACVEELGVEEGERVRVVDGVVAGLVILEGLLRVRGV